MHFVDCGEDPPASFQDIVAKGFGDPVAYANFIPDLREPFNWLCGYCERKCTEPPPKEKPKRDDDNTVDHFRPVSRFPDREFEWENLVYACYRCNTKVKGNKFPSSYDSPHLYLAHALRYAAKSNFSGAFVNPDSYVNPRDPDERAEEFFAFNANGEILPAEGLRNDKWSKAVRMIADLDLNPDDTGSNSLGTLRTTKWVQMKRLMRENPPLAQMIGDLGKAEFPTLVKWVLNHPD